MIQGPAIGAAIGARCAGSATELMVAISRSATIRELSLLHALDLTKRLVRLVDEPQLQWSSPSILGDTVAWKMRGDPRRWHAKGPPELLVVSQNIVVFMATLWV